MTEALPSEYFCPVLHREQILFPLMLTVGIWGALGDAPAVDYSTEVKPLLAAHCVRCHGATKPRAELRLDTAGGLAKGGRSGPAVLPGNADESPVMLAVLGEGTAERMPFKKAPLAAAEIALLRRWIVAGAKAPENEAPSLPPVHWAFIPPSRPTPPAVKNIKWIRNSIDQFVLASLEKAGIAPSPEADRPTLIRRASLDLTGLPPKPADLDAFIKDDQEDAYERMIDRLLGSPHYGERWGRLWLDAARYADSNGYSIDAPRHIWPYRDWVIDALNRDQPFNEFTIDQIAGDLRPGATLAQQVATGFHRNTPINQEGGIDVEQFRIDSIHDRVGTTATVWLGLTMACCQCHDHKYDPLPQSDYYRMFAYLNNVDEIELPIASAETVAKAEAVETSIRQYLAKIARDDPTLWNKQKAWETSLDMVARQKQSQEVRTAFDVVFEKRSDADKRIVFAAFIDQDPAMKVHGGVIAELRKSAPKIITSMVVRERNTPRETFCLTAGDFTRPAEKVTAGVPEALPKLANPATDASRMALACWIVDPGNPLTARVTVNRLWQVYFGRGIVETENDFGTQGTPPSQPELLDFLATEFVDSGWSLKAIHRLIVTSSTYRRSSRLREDLRTLDPDNRLLARQSRIRLDAELVRDSALAASGLLTTTLGGPSVFPPQPEGVMNFGQMRREWTTSTNSDRYRRGLYTFFWRATPHPLFTLFDAPDGTRACTRRLRSNTPLQALMLLNDEAFVEFASAMAARAIQTKTTDADRLELAFRSGLARPPSPGERNRLQTLLRQQREAGKSEAVAWTTLARVILNLDEFITRE